MAYVIFREGEIQNQNDLLLLSNSHPVVFNADLGYVFISNGFQEFLSTIDILTPISIDLSPVLFSL